MWNSIKTAILLAVLSGLIMILGSALGGTEGMTIAFLLAVLTNGLIYFFSDKIVLKLYRAQPLDIAQHPHVYEIVHELSGRMGLPMPKLWLIQSPMANAFATGRNPRHASVAVTTGILRLLDRHELRGVLAHELSHVAHRDILIGTIAATLATVIGYLARMIQHRALWQSTRRDQKSGFSGLWAAFMVAVLMPLAATLIQLAISRSREFCADETGAELSEDPLALASALEKLEKHIPEAHLDDADMAHATTASLFIVHPFLSRGIMKLFSTHPPLQERVARLQKLYYKMTGR